MSNALKYRPDVDGLRALAILPVVLFHAKLGCQGGFVGVDVFFVISGYLISSLILQELANGTFSIVNFWERRIRRILPPLAVVVVGTLIAAYFLFLPGDFTAVGRSVAAQAGLVSNFYFWKQAGYFSAGQETKPLLHTWSLAVEEQFYVLFPLLLIVLMRRKKNALFHGILCVALVSFVLSVVGTYTANNVKSTFFLLPTRAWELMMGALLVVLRGRISVGGPVREIAGWMGLVLIAWPVHTYWEGMRFPGLAAFPPCLGAALIIFSSESKLSSVGRMLALKPVVFIGLISYSLYLWHWPVLMFPTYLSEFPLSTATHIELLAASFVLAVLSWQFIEKPFRQRRVFQQRPHIFGLAGATMATLLVLGVVVTAMQGFPSRFPAKVMAYADTWNHNPYIINGPNPETKTRVAHIVRFSTKQTNRPADVLVWGDSHAMALTPVIDQFCRQHSLSDMVAESAGTPPVCGPFSIKGTVEKSPIFATSVFDYITRCRPRIVILGSKWSIYTPTDSFKSNLLATVRGLTNLGARVYIIKDVPIPGYNVPRFAALAAKHHDDGDLPGMTPAHYEQVNHDMEATLDQAAKMGATVLDPTPFFLDQHGLYAVQKDDLVLYYDTDHVSVEGSLMLAPLFEQIFHTE